MSKLAFECLDRMIIDPSFKPALEEMANISDRNPIFKNTQLTFTGEVMLNGGPKLLSISISLEELPEDEDEE